MGAAESFICVCACAHACGAVFMVASITKPNRNKNKKNKQQKPTNMHTHVYVLSAQGRELREEKTTKVYLLCICTLSPASKDTRTLKILYFYNCTLLLQMK